MKKIITAVSIAMGVSCAFLLAQADDIQSANPPSDSSSMSGQQAGSADNAAQAPDNMSSESKTTTTETKMSKKDHWASATECTDSTGMTYKKGTKSFTRCINVKRSQERAQMNQENKSSEQGGTSGSSDQNQSNESTTTKSDSSKTETSKNNSGW